VGSAPIPAFALELFHYFLMPHNLKRIVGRNDLHFITFTCYQRRHFLRSVRSKNVAARILGEVRARFRFALVGHVLMADHVHLLISEPAGASPAKIIQVFKQSVSRELRAKKRVARQQLSFQGRSHCRAVSGSAGILIATFTPAASFARSWTRCMRIP
jgi:putative transposase